MKKAFRLFLLVSVWLSLLGPGVFAQPYPSDIQRILKRKKVVVAVIAGEYPPLIMTGAEGRPQGFDALLAADIAKELGVEVEFVRQAQTFDQVVELVAKRQADLGISFLTVTLHRAKMVMFSEPYLILHYALLINRLQLMNHSRKSSLRDVRDTTATIGVLKESADFYIARTAFPYASLKEFGSMEEMVEAVRKGEVFAVLGDDFMKLFLKHDPSAALHLEFRVLQDLPNPIAIAVRPDSPHLLSWLNVYLQTKGLQQLAPDALINHNPLQKFEAPRPGPEKNREERGGGSGPTPKR